MTDPDTDPTRLALAQTAARTSDATADLWASVVALWLSVRAARTAGSSVAGIGRELRQGRGKARHHRSQNRIKPSVRLAAHSEEVIAAATANGLTAVRVFGSCARGEDTPASDIELLVTISEHTSLLDLSGFVIAVADLLGLPEARVDVYEDNVLRTSSALRDRIAAEMQPLATWAANRRV